MKTEVYKKQLSKKEGELKFFIEKYKDEYKLKEKIVTLESQIREMSSAQPAPGTPATAISPDRKMRARAMSKNSKINLEIAQDLENENEIRSLQIQNANMEQKIAQLEEISSKNTKLAESLQAENEDLKSMVNSLECEIDEYRDREEKHDLELEEERRIAEKEVLNIVSVILSNSCQNQLKIYRKVEETRKRLESWKKSEKSMKIESMS